MNKISNFSFLSLAVSVALFGTSPTLKADKCDDCTTTDLAQCLGTCNQGDAKAKAMCGAACLVAMGICKGSFCPDLYALRNASMFRVNFFRESDGKLLGTRGRGIDLSSRLDVEGSDFPIVAAREDKCPDLKDPKCTTDARLGIRIPNKGCFIVWNPNIGESEFSITSEVCRKQATKNTVERQPLPPARSPSESKKTNPAGKKTTVKEKSNVKP